ncbi:MAG: hypothetical protein QNJ13_01540 [Paracoccaceae bacterium]|nr:hypothetical protein [Paracoccaceae bacterium]
MDADLLLFLGIVIGAFAFPTLVGSFSAGQSPRAAIVFGCIGGALIVAAIAMTPGGYEFNEIPGIMVRVVRDAFN